MSRIAGLALVVLGCGARTGLQTSDDTGDAARARDAVVDVPGQTGRVAVGGGHACARRATGRVLCWGNNVFGRLGDGTTTDRATPTPVLGLR